jgi:D-alanine-D-alanine ligase
MSALLPVLPLRVALLAGGESDERAISLKSGAAVRAALASHGRTVVPIDPALVDLAGIDWSAFDIAFLALHGRFGEDGQVQVLLEAAGIPFTGSSAEASRLAFSKSAAKERFQLRGVPTPDAVLVHYSDDWARMERQAQQLGYPLVVKPDTQGSSLGVSLVSEPSQLTAALQHAFQFDTFVLFEQMISGSEWTVGLLDQQVFPPIEIHTTRHFFDYQAKYSDDTTEYRFPATDGTTVADRVVQAAVAAHEALGTSGLARVDLRVDTHGHPWVLEINTIPGLTDHSLVPKAAAKAGIEFSDLCERTIWGALRAWEQSRQTPHVEHGRTSAA